MWVAVLLAGWFITSLLMGPWIGRFVSAHGKIREEPLASNRLTGEAETTKPIPLARRA
jgi:hypothetical protein